MKRVKKLDRWAASSPGYVEWIGSPRRVAGRSSVLFETRRMAALLIIAGVLLVFGFMLDNYLAVLPYDVSVIDRFFSIGQLHHESFMLLGFGFVLGVALMYGLTKRG